MRAWTTLSSNFTAASFAAASLSPSPMTDAYSASATASSDGATMVRLSFCNACIGNAPSSAERSKGASLPGGIALTRCTGSLEALQARLNLGGIDTSFRPQSSAFTALPLLTRLAELRAWASSRKPVATVEMIRLPTFRAAISTRLQFRLRATWSQYSCCWVSPNFSRTCSSRRTSNVIDTSDVGATMVTSSASARFSKVVGFLPEEGVAARRSCLAM
mmetsp:Transcript_24353/g.54269  ORF Transcript_24353/g.54269 Transcript_24353/m.54269 type:complete len:218 (+) Transcript_24353:1058-1711(+)